MRFDSQSVIFMLCYILSWSAAIFSMHLTNHKWAHSIYLVNSISMKFHRNDAHSVDVQIEPYWCRCDYNEAPEQCLVRCNKNVFFCGNNICKLIGFNVIGLFCFSNFPRIKLNTWNNKVDPLSRRCSM